jgi:adenylate kinase
MKMVLLGPPGSGKGTRAHIISDLYGIPVVTTGDMLRGAVREETEYGKVAKEYMDRGDLVPNSIVNGVVRERMSRPDVADGFILDGFPRSPEQADALDEILSDLGTELTHVLYVVLSDDIIIQRLSNRRSCPKCGAVYHLESAQPRKAGVCDVCGAKLIQRDDDKEEVIRHRLEVYRKNTEPLLERYREKGLIVETSGEIPMDKLKENLKDILG